MRSLLRAARVASLVLVAAACHKDATGPAARSALFVSPSALTLSVGDSLPPGHVVTAQLQNADGTTTPAGAVSWSSSDASVVAVTGDNSIVARGTGFAVITARSGTQRAELSISVQARQSSFYITPAAVALVPNSTATLAPHVANPDGSTSTPAGVTYQSTDGAVATVSAAGVVTAHALGSATIIARLGNQVATVAISVQATPVATVELTPTSGTLLVGDNATLAATTKDAAGQPLANRFVSWSSSDPAIATVDNTGLVVGRGVGVAQITASAEGKSAVANIQVTPLPTASVVLTPAALAVPRLESGTLTARVTDSGGASVDNPPGTLFTTANAGIATVDASGHVSGVAEGTVEIYASYGGKADTAIVTVAPARVASVTVSPAAATIPMLDTVSFVAIARDIVGGVITGRTVTWTSSNNAVASVSAGAVAANALGSAVVSATVDGVSGAAQVDVTLPRAVSMTISPLSPTLQEGDTLRFTGTAYDKNGNAIAGKPISYSSSNSSALIIDAVGLALAVDARFGSVSVVATSPEGISAITSVSISAPPVATVSVTPSSFALRVGSSTTLDAIARDAGFQIIAGASFTWSSSNAAKATVDASGTVTAVSPGIATISAIAANGVTGTATVTVTP
jgi:uncharacterized protein YjdB